MVTDSATVTTESLWETTIALSNGAIAAPHDLPSPKSGCSQDTRMTISLQRVIRCTSCLVLKWGFLGRRIEWRYFRFEQNPRWQPPPCWKNFKSPYIRNRLSDPLHVWFRGRVFGDGGSNGAIFGSNKSKVAAAAILDNFEWLYLRNGSRSTYIARIARSSLL